MAVRTAPRAPGRADGLRGYAVPYAYRCSRAGGRLGRGRSGRAPARRAWLSLPCGGSPSPACAPPFAPEGTERRIGRPQDPAEQTRCDSGTKKCQTVKNLRLLNAPLTLLFLRETAAGRIHDKRLADTPPYPLPAGRQLLPDLGFLAFTLPQVEILRPTQKPRQQELTLEQKAAHHALARRRVRIEHVNSSVKRWRLVNDTLRLLQAGLRALVRELCCALPNFRLRLTPWLPMT